MWELTGTDRERIPKQAQCGAGLEFGRDKGVEGEK